MGKLASDTVNSEPTELHLLQVITLFIYYFTALLFISTTQTQFAASPAQVKSNKTYFVNRYQPLQ